MTQATDPKADPVSFVWMLVDGEQRARDNPDTFELPSRAEREQLAPGAFAKLIFVTPEIAQQNMGERMWVRVTKRSGKGASTKYRGELDNTPGLISGLHVGSVIDFEPKHVVDIQNAKASGGGGALLLLAFALFGHKRRSRR